MWVHLWFQGFFPPPMRLQRRDLNAIGDISGRAATRQIVGRAIEPLQDRAERLSARQALYELVGNVARVEVREDEHVGAPCYRRPWRLRMGHLRQERGVGLKF